MRRLPLLLLVAAAPALAAPPAAVRERVALLDVMVSGDAPHELRTSLVTSLGGGMYAAGWEQVPQKDVDAALASAPGLSGCATPTCLEQLSGKLGSAKLFMRARVAAAGSTYSIELDLLAPSAAGGLIAHVEQKCEVCTLPELNEAMSQAAVQLQKRAVEQTKAPGASYRVEITSTPRGATVRIDGVESGQTPLQTDLPAGKHTIVVHDTGWNDEPRILVVTPEGPNQLEVALTAAAVPVPATPHTHRTHFRLGLAASVAGGLMTATGLYLLSIDGKGTCGGPGECKHVYDTKLLGVAGVGLGVAALGAGIYWLTRKQTDEPALVVPTSGGAALLVTGRF
jgi:hypothetical protein